MRSAIIVYNPAAGRYSVKPFVKSAVRELESAGWKVDMAETQSGEHTVELAQQAAAVVVVGAPGMGHDEVLIFDRFAARVPGRQFGNPSRLSRKMGLADLVASARRSRRQGKERS